MQKPIPDLAPANSATIAPVTAKTTDIFNPEKIEGKAFFHRNNQNICHSEAASDLKKYSCSISIFFNPLNVFIKTGKKQINADKIVLDIILVPNQIVSKGAMATIGIVFIPIAYGNIAFSNVLAKEHAIPSRIPLVEPNKNPNPVSREVVQV